MTSLSLRRRGSLAEVSTVGLWPPHSLFPNARIPTLEMPSSLFLFHLEKHFGLFGEYYWMLRLPLPIVVQ